MASGGHERATEDYGVSSIAGCSRTPQPETQDSLQTPSQSSALCRAPVPAADWGPCLRRNVVSERERRRRISLSCERLRALLPQFDGRREDMASVLEMSVYFLQLAHSVEPSWGPLSVPQPPQEMWHMWQGDVLQVTLANQIADSKPDSGIAQAPAAAAAAARVQDPPCCGMLDTDQSQATDRVVELLERPSSCPGKCQRTLSFSEPESSSLGPGLSPWLPHPWQAATPEPSDFVSGGSHQVGSLARDTESPGMLAEEANLVLASVPDARYTTGAGSEVVDGSFLLTTNPDWWLGSVEGRGGPALARSSPMDGAEPSFIGDPETCSQELQAVPAELWGLDFGSPGLALKDEADTIFPDFFP
ncbi:spermatogenesis- and oogenesis-specific basic helix-loop-helix-containing protein 1 isoform X1 [Apodemus sylvaticus]|uniref:spermatogenesis- and oogenesis-specific basic helix-loop-helix-containing protein 1 isoform X1 n=1 Tax=Apodemus sylvaticus TaxID=10129 RepID=UPI002244BDC5|nr:spermatogenesis- and oogenesis-specific basic helix-loop-helix-containing protein 1 isoform X1 [Apodemus sylvaticus]